MNNLQIFNNPDFGEIRTWKEDSGAITFCAPDAARALGYSNTSDAINRHCKEDGVAFHEVIDSMGRMQKTKFITKGNLCRLAASSGLPGAEKFESWIFDDVIPSVLEHGMYAVDDLLDNPDLLIGVATKLKEERARNKQLSEDKERLQIELDGSMEWLSIKRVAAVNGMSHKDLDWRALKKAGEAMGYGTRKTFYANYGTVNTYHRKVWAVVYPEYRLEAPNG